MLPRWHVLSGILGSLILFFLDFNFLHISIFFLSSVLIDLDHVLLYFVKKKNLNPKKFFIWMKECEKKFSEKNIYEREKYKLPVFFLHGIEFLFILTILSLFYFVFYFVLLGVFVHLILDWIDIYRKRKFYHHSLKTSQILLWQRNKNKSDLYQ